MPANQWNTWSCASGDASATLRLSAAAEAWPLTSESPEGPRSSEPPSRPREDSGRPDPPDGPPGILDRGRCQVVGLNDNHLSTSGTPYHVQIEDRGPVLDRLTDKEVRRVNLIVYANYGEANARIIHGQDYDFPDVRTPEHNQFA